MKILELTDEYDSSVFINMSNATKWYKFNGITRIDFVTGDSALVKEPIHHIYEELQYDTDRA